MNSVSNMCNWFNRKVHMFAKIVEIIDVDH